MNKKWQGVILVGSLLASGLINARASYLNIEGVNPAFLPADPTSTLLTTSPTLNEVFFNLNKTSVGKAKEPQLTTGKPYKAHLKQLLSLQVNNHLQVGVERVKVTPLSSLQSEMIEVNPQLQPKTQQPKARGYGVELKMKFD